MTVNNFLHVLTEKGLRYIIRNNQDHPEVVGQARRELIRRQLDPNTKLEPKPRPLDGYERDR